MNAPLDLCVTLTEPPDEGPSGAIASIALRCEELGLSHTGGLLTDPLTPRERRDLQWYLEEYWMWPYAGFARRGKEVEALLAEVGSRLYNSVLEGPQAISMKQAWSAQPSRLHQISIVSAVPAALSLPWELLHDGLGFLALHASQPVSIVRRLPVSEMAAHRATFTPPLRILLVTAQPEGTGFVDPRSIARELLDELGMQIEGGTIELEFLRPPTLAGLRTRLRDRRRPIHVLHFDGHGVFGAAGVKQGMLAFESEEGGLDAVAAERVAWALQDSGVRLVVLTACQSALGSQEDSSSSVAAQLTRCGVDAVVAMSSTILAASAARYAEAFYRALATGAPVSGAHEQARRALHNDPRRHPQRRHQDEAGTPVALCDWWMPHLYQQRPVFLQPMQPTQRRKKPPAPTAPRLLSEGAPGEPRYGFFGRARELLRIERWLAQGKAVVISGFGGTGKTALAREAADWLTRTKMYGGACFISFEHGGDAALLLGTLGHTLGVSDELYNPHDGKAALASLGSILKERRALVIADNLESVLPAGEAPLEPEACRQLWDVLLELLEIGTGVLLTSRDPALGDGRITSSSRVAYLPLRGLRPNDSYALAAHLLDCLKIDRACAPYAELRDLLAQLDHHPLAIQLVLPVLKDVSISAVRTEFESLLPKFADDAETGRNGSLLASLDYSLRRLSAAQRGMLSSFTLFAGGASEDNLLAITRIPEDEWVKLRQALEQAALLQAERVHRGAPAPFLRFHPVLTPFLRNDLETEDATLFERYIQRYYDQARSLYMEDKRNPGSVRARIWYELPNLRQTLDFLLQLDEKDAASNMSTCLADFLDRFGLWRERDEIRRRVAAVLAVAEAKGERALTGAEWLYESGRGEDEYQSGNTAAALVRFQSLLARVEGLSEGVPLGRKSYQHYATLHRLARCFKLSQQPASAQEKLDEALAIIGLLIEKQPDNRLYIRQRGLVLADVGDVALLQGRYERAREAYEEALALDIQLGDGHAQAVTLVQLGALALEQGMRAEARSSLSAAREIFHALNEPTTEAIVWYQLGRVAEEGREWDEARNCYRESLALDERIGNLAGVVNAYNQLALVAQYTDRPTEAESWYERALGLEEQISSSNHLHATLLNNLANLLLSEVWKRRAPAARLTAARAYAERALALEEGDDTSSEVWTTLYILAVIASLEGQPEKAREFHRREQEAFAAFAGNRHHIDRHYGRLIMAIAAAADTPEVREALEEVLRQLEAKGWHIATAARRIWAGERDWHLLADGLDRQEALLILRVLETLTSPAHTQIPEEQSGA